MPPTAVSTMRRAHGAGGETLVLDADASVERAYPADGVHWTVWRPSAHFCAQRMSQYAA